MRLARRGGGLFLESYSLAEKKIGIGIQARLTSKRFPRKVLEELWEGRSILDHCVKQAFALSRKLEVRRAEVYLALLVPSSQQKEFKNLRPDLAIFSGSEDENDVFSRYDLFFEKIQPDYLIRITADCPVWSPELAFKVLKSMMEQDADFGWVKTPDPYPDGLDVEIMRKDLFKRMQVGIKHEGIREHVTIGLKGSDVVKPRKTMILRGDPRYSRLPKLSIDEQDDLKRLQEIRGDLFWI
jgi:spore coat polysaccharide biosynthesis protein SpsF